MKYDVYLELYKTAEKCRTFDELLKKEKEKEAKELLKIWDIVKSSPADFCISNKGSDLEKLGERLGINPRTLKNWVWDRKHIPNITRLLLGYIFLTNGEIKKN